MITNHQAVKQPHVQPIWHLCSIVGAFVCIFLFGSLLVCTIVRGTLPAIHTNTSQSVLYNVSVVQAHGTSHVSIFPGSSTPDSAYEGLAN